MLIEGIYSPELTERTVYLKQTDMTVASTEDVSAELFRLIDGAPKWIHTTKGLNAAGQTVYIKMVYSYDPPSFVP